jgi:hypothetical protein
MEVSKGEEYGQGAQPLMAHFGFVVLGELEVRGRSQKRL